MSHSGERRHCGIHAFSGRVDAQESIKKIHFRITDSQMIEAYGDVGAVFEPLIKAVRALWNR